MLPARAAGLIYEQAALMAPGEWRNIGHLTNWPGKNDGTSFKSFQYVRRTDGGDGGADGMGWTNVLVEYQGKLMMVFSRSSFEHGLMVMEADGTFWRLNHPQGFTEGKASDPGGRRPFNRLSSDGEHLYFAPADARYEMGYLIRTPLKTPGVFERIGPSFNDGQMDDVGNFAVTYVPDWGRFYAYTPGGKVWSWAIDESDWTLHGRLPTNAEGRRPTGYAGYLLWNEIKQELAIIGGQHFDRRQPSVSYMQYRLTEPLGAPERMADRRNSDGGLLNWSSNTSSMLIDPRDGGYIFRPGTDTIWFKANDLNSPFVEFDDMGGTQPFGRYNYWAPHIRLPGTDVIAFIHHINGLILWRLPALNATRDAPALGSRPAVTPDNHANHTATSGTASLDLSGTRIGQIATSLKAGEVSKIEDSKIPPGYADFTRWFLKDREHDKWGDVIHWHPSTASIYFQGLERDGNTFIRYDAMDDAWSDLPLEGGPVKETSSYHVYNKLALDAERGHYYRLWRRTGRRNALLRYDISLGKWEMLADPIPIRPIEASSEHSFIPMLWHPGLQRLVIVRNRHAWAIDPERAASMYGYTDLGRVGVHGYHSTSEYNTVRGDMICLGGNYSRTTVTLIGRNGEITRLPDLPFPHKISADSLTHDPASGRYLIYRSETHELWELDDHLDLWRVSRRFDRDPWQPRYGGLRLAPIPELGVIFIQSADVARLYKHSDEVALSNARMTEQPTATSPQPKPVPPPFYAPPTPEAASPPMRTSNSSNASVTAPAPNARALSASMIRAIRASRSQPHKSSFSDH
ncbi:hypothetical protein ACKVEX_05135 [Rhodocyclaceae bacterium SMB388]